MFVFKSQTPRVDKIVFDDHNRLYVGCTADPRFRGHRGNRGVDVWDCLHGQLHRHILGNDYIDQFGVTPNGEWVIVVTAEVCRAVHQETDTRFDFPPRIRCLGFLTVSPCGDVVFGSHSHAIQHIERWRFPPGSVPPHKLWSTNTQGWITQLLTRPTGDLVVFQVPSHRSQPSRFAVTYDRDAAKKRSERTLDDMAWEHGFWTDGGDTLVAVASRACHVVDWKSPGAKPRTIPFNRITGAALHPNGRHLLVVNRGESVTVCDVVSGETIRTIPWKVGRLRTVATSPDGTLAAAASRCQRHRPRHRVGLRITGEWGARFSHRRRGRQPADVRSDRSTFSGRVR